MFPRRDLPALQHFTPPISNQGMYRSDACSAWRTFRRIDRFRRHDYIGDQTCYSPTRQGNWRTNTRENAMTSSVHASFGAIGLQLRAEYLPAIGRPLPPELKDLLAQLVALEA